MQRLNVLIGQAADRREKLKQEFTFLIASEQRCAKHLATLCEVKESNAGIKKDVSARRAALDAQQDNNDDDSAPPANPPPKRAYMTYRSRKPQNTSARAHRGTWFEHCPRRVDDIRSMYKYPAWMKSGLRQVHWHCVGFCYVKGENANFHMIFHQRN